MNMEPEYKPRKWRVLGTTPVRRDGIDKVTGQAKFGDDVHLPDMLHGKVVRSPHPHARIKRIDVSKALAVPGVKAVITGADFPPLNQAVVAAGEGGSVSMQDIADNCIAKHTVFYDGHAVAAVAADSPHVAEEAAALVEVEYEILPFIQDVREAVKDGAVVLHDDFVRTPAACSWPPATSSRASRKPTSSSSASSPPPRCTRATSSRTSPPAAGTATTTSRCGPRPRARSRSATSWPRS
jgi:CO/xanthine dehydrogenase Mo-binding subunit